MSAVPPENTALVRSSSVIPCKGLQLTNPIQDEVSIKPLISRKQSLRQLVSLVDTFNHTMTIRQTVYCVTVFATLACDGGKDSRAQLARDEGAPVASASAPAPEMREQAMNMEARGKFAVSATGDASQAASPPGSAPQPPTDAATPAMMIRNGYATLEVSKLDPAIVQVRALATKVGGYVTNSSTSGGRDQIRSAMLELRVPARRYDEAVTALAEIGRVETTQTSAQDVGEEFVDLTARVANLRKLEDRLIDLLTNRTGRLQDVLAVERELSRVRTEIDQIEGRLRYLKNRVSLSTLTVNLHEPQPLIGNTPGENPISAAVRQAWRNFVGFFASVIASLGILIPLGILGLLAWMGVKRWNARRRGKNLSA